MSPTTTDCIHRTDYSFYKLCEQLFGINKGVYNSIDSMFYNKGIHNIIRRRQLILSFLEFAVGKPSEEQSQRYKFGHGGLSLKINEFCLLNLDLLDQDHLE